ncbi:MAG: transcription termination/antitermination protein NusG [Thermodesulfobacteriota bacterium]
MDWEGGFGKTTHDGGLHWFVIHTKPRDEGRVKSNVEKMEVETLLPLYKSIRFLHGRMCKVSSPLFPNYLFARLNLERDYYKVKWTRGVNRIVGIGNEPTPVAEVVIEMLRDRMADDDTVQLVDDLQEGNLIRVTSGLLKDFVGVFQKGLSSDGRVRVLLNLVGRDLPVQIDRWQIQKVA